MAPKKPFTDLAIATQDTGCYDGPGLPIAISSKAVMVALVPWAPIRSRGAGGMLSSLNTQFLNGSPPSPSSPSASS